MPKLDLGGLGRKSGATPDSGDKNLATAYASAKSVRDDPMNCAYIAETVQTEALETEQEATERSGDACKQFELLDEPNELRIELKQSSEETSTQRQNREYAKDIFDTIFGEAFDNNDGKALTEVLFNSAVEQAKENMGEELSSEQEKELLISYSASMIDNVSESRMVDSH